MALTNAERQRAFRLRQQAGDKVLRYRRPADRRSRPQRWLEAVQELLGVLDDYQQWRDNMPPGVEDTTTAAKIDEVLELRDIVEQLEAADLPKGFGRD